MLIWKLTPTNLADPIWKLWSPEPIIVRAESEADARRLAHFKTLKYLPATPGMPFRDNPWAGYKKTATPDQDRSSARILPTRPASFR
jgi:hypothetical protein